MESTVTITIPSSWLGNQALDQVELRRALQVGLAQLRREQSETKDRVVQTLLSTGRVRRLLVVPPQDQESRVERQEPPTLPGKPVSEILIAQRRSEL
jgi:hypothetical protein